MDPPRIHRPCAPLPPKTRPSDRAPPPPSSPPQGRLAKPLQTGEARYGLNRVPRPRSAAATPRSAIAAPTPQSTSRTDKITPATRARPASRSRPHRQLTVNSTPGIAMPVTRSAANRNACVVSGASPQRRQTL